MKSDLILFIPNLQKVQEATRSGWIESLTTDELLSEVYLGEIVILEQASGGNYLFLPNVDLGFIFNLKQSLSDAAKSGSPCFVSNSNQDYDLEVSASKDRFQLRDRTRAGTMALSLDAKAFKKSVHQCAANQYELLRRLLPEIALRPDASMLARLFTPLPG